ncbi:MAG: response regulator [Elusimicrobia bacterium]|nr:response regulator [Elusimicrobiota bacterium]
MEDGRPLVLIVDDEKGLRDMLSYGLARMGYRIVAAADGSQALEAARLHKPALAVCDLMMPGIDGSRR